MPNRAEILKQHYQNSLGLPLTQVPSETAIAEVIEEYNVCYRQVLYTPIVVLWAWISQVIDSDKSLSNGVGRVTSWLALEGETIPLADTGG